jgi:hypothetical protein
MEEQLLNTNSRQSNEIEMIAFITVDVQYQSITVAIILS